MKHLLKETAAVILTPFGVLTWVAAFYAVTVVYAVAELWGLINADA